MTVPQGPPLWVHEHNDTDLLTGSHHKPHPHCLWWSIAPALNRLSCNAGSSTRCEAGRSKEANLWTVLKL